ncbi:AfsR/SARP family transcriptional regulator [Nonomuraea guangzhouensis]|uniref:Helix-turn-helix domain-containing protein n=1 Tax=Nonomuraea guangzhouensis TaxID=1291555 RepID=A0ABW4G294_9ACTN|nr:helix-turn-helix domain-containing protein [Nonomuraea guangzhouensis]
MSGPRRKAVLAMLALHRGEIVSNDRLADVIWAGNPPATPLNTVQRHVSHLRQVLGRAAGTTRHQRGARPQIPSVADPYRQADGDSDHLQRTQDPEAHKSRAMLLNRPRLR